MSRTCMLQRPLWIPPLAHMFCDVDISIISTILEISDRLELCCTEVFSHLRSGHLISVTVIEEIIWPLCIGITCTYC